MRAITPDDATNKSMIWSSNNPAVATVDDDGMVTAISNGNATITVTTLNGNHTATCDVIVKTSYSSVELAESLTVHSFPNPTDGLITIEFSTQGFYHLTILDIAGRVILRKPVAEQSVQLDLSSYAAGIYVLMVDDGKQTSILRIVKQ